MLPLGSSPLPAALVAHAKALGEEHLALEVVSVAEVVERIIGKTAEGARGAGHAGIEDDAQVLVVLGELVLVLRVIIHASSYRP